MTKASSFILRLYFAVISAVTLFTLMYGAIDFLSIGLKAFVFPAADVPEYGLELCDMPGSRYPESKPVPAPSAVTTDPTAEEIKAACELRNADNMANYERTKASNAVRNLALIIVSLPLFAAHFRVVYKDWVEERKAKA